MKIKKFNAMQFTLFTLGVLMLAVITFYTFNLVFTVVGNHQALDLVSLSGIPMLLMFVNLLIILIVGYRYLIKPETDLYLVRRYSVASGIISLVGIATSIFTGTVIYDSFVKDYVFKCYPLISLIVFVLMLALCVCLFVFITKKVKAENIEKTYKLGWYGFAKLFGMSSLIIYALERLGAFLLIPIYYSPTDGAYTIPYLIQLLVPSLLVIMFVLQHDVYHSRKLSLILSCSALGYSVFSLVYMYLMARGNYPLTVNSLSAIQQFERLVVYPISAIIMYISCGLTSIIYGVKCLVKMLKEKKD